MDTPGTPALLLASHATPDEMLSLSAPGGSSAAREGQAWWRSAWPGTEGHQLSALTACGPGTMLRA